MKKNNMKPILLLPEEVSSKIAAGEVIERPSSIVKELLENSIDANSNSISLEIVAGGITSIYISDDGNGIPKDQINLAFQRFATSKVGNLNDLNSITTLGFRGEALPSIAAIANIHMTTQTQNEQFGHQVISTPNKPLEITPHGTSFGTSIKVSHIFENFPARKKFLRSTRSEAAKIYNICAQYAISFPNIRLKLIADSKTILATSGSDNLLDTIYEVYGKELQGKTITIDSASTYSNEEIKIVGILGAPPLHKGSSKLIQTFVNNRSVENRMLSYAIRETYTDFLPHKRFPVAIINISIPPDQVDVNVHPTKSIVKFLDEGKIFSTIQKTIRTTLTEQMPIPDLSGKSVNINSFDNQIIVNTKEQDNQNRFSIPSANISNQLPIDINKKKHPDITQKEIFDSLYPIGQIKKTYIIAEGSDAIYIIDQHAAHERILFEDILGKINQGITPKQSLIEPLIISPSPAYIDIIEKHMDTIQKIGFEISHFGSSSYLLQAIPPTMSKHNLESGFLKMIESIQKSPENSPITNQFVSSIACHSAIKSGDKIHTTQITKLINDLSECKNFHTCPHGRPTIFQLTTDQLEKEFARRK